MDEARIEVRVTPRAAHARLSITEGGVRAWVHEPPSGGAANDAVIALLSKKLGVPKSTMKIVGGARGRNKTVAFSGITEPQLDQIIKERLK